jgi:hypothetical protein
MESCSLTSGRQFPMRELFLARDDSLIPVADAQCQQVVFNRAQGFWPGNGSKRARSTASHE